MAKIISFNFISLDGYFEGPEKGNFSWHVHDAEGDQFSEKNLSQGATLVFGRKTYDMMRGYWTSPMAMENSPKVTKGMNDSDKIVLSRKLKKADWQNTKVVSGDIVKAMKKIKKSSKSDMVILGSGSIVKLFARHELIDEYQIMIDPVFLGKGTLLFKSIGNVQHLELTSSKVFKNGSVLLHYKKA